MAEGQGRGALGSQNAAEASVSTFEDALTIAPPTIGSEPFSSLARVHHSVKFTIACLYKLPLRHPASLDRLKQKDFLSFSLYQHFDVLYVKDKFPQLDLDVSSRLGRMITRRRQLLWYRVSHSQKLESHGPQANVFIPISATKDLMVIRKETQVARHAEDIKLGPSQPASSHSTLPTKATMLKISDPPSEEQLFAPSISESIVSTGSSYTGRELKIEIPPRPKGDKGNELHFFECPYCGVAKSIRTKHQWR